MDENHVGYDGDGQVPQVLGEDGADENVAEKGAGAGMFYQIDVGYKTRSCDDDHNGGGEIAGCQAKDESVAKLSTSSIEDVRQNDEEGADEGEAANDHVNIIGCCANALLLESGIGVCSVVSSGDAD